MVAFWLLRVECRGTITTTILCVMPPRQREIAYQQSMVHTEAGTGPVCSDVRFYFLVISRSPAFALFFSFKYKFNSNVSKQDETRNCPHGNGMCGLVHPGV
mmetsp:Transcript_19789/g.32521  ORF Transcript_19789/g.32521 Transcript_19789/m.32521 type:complete len:101 (+) Transcript_19789:1009-1311(+)